MKFTIRGLLLVTLVVALAVAWWLDRSRLAGESNRLRRMFDSNWLSEYDSNATYYHGRDTEVIVLPDPSAPAPNPPKP